MEHPQVAVNLPGGRTVGVDEKMVDMVEACLDFGLITMSCCQDLGESVEDLRPETVGPYAYIDFTTVPDAVTFFNLIMAGGPSPQMWHRMNYWSDPWAWKKVIFLVAPGRVFGVHGCQVQFPVGDIDEITICLRKAATIWEPMSSDG